MQQIPFQAVIVSEGMLARKGNPIRMDTRMLKYFSVRVELVEGSFEGCECGFCDISTTSKVACIKESTESFDDFIVHMPTYSSKIDL